MGETGTYYTEWSKPERETPTQNINAYIWNLEKAEETEIKLPKSAGSSKKQESSRKTSTSALLTMPKPLTGWIKTNCGKFFKRWEYQTTWLVSWDTCIQVKKRQLELDMEQMTGSKLGQEYNKAEYYHSVCLTVVQSTLCEMLGRMNHKMESRLPGEILTNICTWYHSNGRKGRGTKKNSWWGWKRRVKKLA